MNTGDTAWVLMSAALVLLMTPGVALFYGGMVRATSVLNMLMMSFGGLAVVGLLWVLVGYSMAFAPDLGGGLLGNPLTFMGLRGLLDPAASSGSIPVLAFVAFQAMFACLTVALISGAVADRTRFAPWLIFCGLWALAVYFPVAHWVFAFDETNAAGEVVQQGGWIANDLGALDFAGGTAVHINAGAAALVLATVVGARSGFGREPMRPHNLPLVMLGAGLLWFGWFGFNAGSALGAGPDAAFAFVNTFSATCAAVLAWLLVERLRDGHATTLGAASGLVAGLVAITPAAAAVTPLGGVAIGALAGAASAWAVSWKYRLGYDDSLDVVGVHLVSGLVGTVLIGLLAAPTSPAGVSGLCYDGGFDQLWRQAVGAGAVLAYSLVVTGVIAVSLRYTVGLRIHPDHELAGIDELEHAESAYQLGGFAGRRMRPLPRAGASALAATAEAEPGIAEGSLI